MKKYSKFLNEEITIKGNPGVPGEDGDNKRNDPQYLTGVEAQGRRMAGGMDNQMLAMRYGREIMGMVNQSMQLMIGDIVNPQTYYGGRADRNQVRRVQERFRQLEQLAEDLVREHYPEILEDVELDIKLLGPQKVAEFMEEEEAEPSEPPTFQELQDPDIKKEVHKRKLANNVIQGEAKNAKHMLHHEMVREKLTEIYDERKAAEIFDIWDRITGIADKLDWLVPIDIKARMMEESPEGFAGAVKVDWKPKEVKPEDPNKNKDKKPKDEDGEEEKERDESIPVIKARGIDFPMLLHETIKGLFELISAKGIPQNQRAAEISMLNTQSMADEAEDFRYGPKIASDLRDFINLNRNIGRYPNLREHVYGKMIEIPAEDFLSLMKGILAKTADARRRVDEIIDQTISELDRWELKQALPDYDDKEDQYIDNVEESPKDTKEETPSPVEEKDPDYASMGKRQLQQIIDDALEREDYDLLKKVSPFVKTRESLMWKIYESEIKRVLKS